MYGMGSVKGSARFGKSQNVLDYFKHIGFVLMSA